MKYFGPCTCYLFHSSSNVTSVFSLGQFEMCECSYLFSGLNGILATLRAVSFDLPRKGDAVRSVDFGHFQFRLHTKQAIFTVSGEKR